MNIYNKQNYFTNKQLLKILNRLGADYEINKLYIIETRHDLLKYGVIRINPFGWIEIIRGKIEGNYLPTSKTVIVYVFAHDEYNDFHSSQLYSIHALLHELRHAYHNNKNIKGSEEDCDEFATRYLDENSNFFSRVMKWEDEWEVEEED
ncbi:hypothetical protein [Lacrimispora sp.]|uniref:hypothetical protein n=1 Tax=Lacrimispora sp. TaxID=2719234 RepID=UPI0028A05015|nr:hypothetical protein [Lacrimispora sp.]